MMTRKLYLWRAWNAAHDRICDCGMAWGETEDQAQQIARMAVGGPHIRDVRVIELESVNWMVDGQLAQVSTDHVRPANPNPKGT